MKTSAAQISIVTFDGENAIECETWRFNGDNLNNLDEFLRLTLDEDQVQRLQLEDEDCNILETVAVQHEDQVAKQIKRWKKAAKTR